MKVTWTAQKINQNQVIDVSVDARRASPAPDTSGDIEATRGRMQGNSLGKVLPAGYIEELEGVFTD